MSNVVEFPLARCCPEAAAVRSMLNDGLAGSGFTDLRLVLFDLYCNGWISLQELLEALPEKEKKRAL